MDVIHSRLYKKRAGRKCKSVLLFFPLFFFCFVAYQQEKADWAGGKKKTKKLAGGRDISVRGSRVE